MTPGEPVKPGSTTLPRLEQLLTRAAHRRYGNRVSGRRWGMPAIFAALVVVGGVTAAAAGVLTGTGAEIERGATPIGGYASGAYVISVKPQAGSEAHGGPICLQLQFDGSRPSYGCGSPPSEAQPFGLVVVDGQAEGSVDRVIYGLVLSTIQRVGVLGEGTEQTIAATAPRPGLPGRFFSVTVPNEGRIEIVGYDQTGGEIARIGSREAPAHKPLSHDQAVAQGDPSGFAPTAVPASTFVYQGDLIDPKSAAERGLVCVDSLQQVVCYDSVAERNAAAED